MRLTTLATIVSYLFASPFVAALRAMRQSNQTMGVKLRALAAGRVKYHGGPVISNVDVVTIFWGGAEKVGIAKQINQFYRGVTNSVYMDWLNEYNIGRGQLLSTYSYDLAPTGTVSQRELERLLKNLISTGHVPPPTANTYYAIHFAPGYYVQGLCSSVCADFSAIKRSIDPIHIHYGVIATPDSSSCSICFFLIDDLFNSATFVASYQLIAAATNPEKNFVNPKQMPKQAWYDPNVGGVTPICVIEANEEADYLGSVVGGNGVTYKVAKGYSNLQSACVTGPP